MKQVNIYTDGSCLGNPGNGGWCAILEYNGNEKIVSGKEPNTTNNRMELTAVIQALSALKQNCCVSITTDSKYVCNAISKGWLRAWQKRGWKKKDKSPVLNVDLWEALVMLMSKHDVKIGWIKGHDGHKYNEKCDSIARQEASSI